MIKTLLTERYTLVHHALTSLKGMLVVFPLCILLFTAQEFGWYNAGNGFFEQISSSLVFGLAFVWSCYIFIITLYYKSRQMVTSLDGVVVSFFFMLGGFVSYLAAEVIFWRLDSTLLGSVFIGVGVLLSSVILGHFIGLSKAKFDSDEVGAWKTRISGFALTTFIVSVAYFCAKNVELPWVYFVALPVVIGSCVLNFYLLQRAFKQFARYISVKKHSERSVHAFYPHLQVGGELISQL